MCSPSEEPTHSRGSGRCPLPESMAWRSAVRRVTWLSGHQVAHREPADRPIALIPSTATCPTFRAVFGRICPTGNGTSGPVQSDTHCDWDQEPKAPRARRERSQIRRSACLAFRSHFSQVGTNAAICTTTDHPRPDSFGRGALYRHTRRFHTWLRGQHELPGQLDLDCETRQRDGGYVVTVVVAMLG